MSGIKMISSVSLVVLALTSILHVAAASTCSQDVKLSFMNGAMYMVAKAKYDYAGKPKDCAELFLMGYHENNVYEVWPVNRLYDNKSMNVYCDMLAKGGGWTVIQRRGNFGNPKDFFDEDWNGYKKGFGSFRGEFWLGNDRIYALTNQKLYTLRIVMRDVENNTRYAEYETFWIDDENSNYTLHISGYRGDAGDSLIRHHNNRPFSTKDRDHSLKYNCGKRYKGGWWYNACHTSNLNGLNLNGTHKDYANGIGWYSWKTFYESLFAVEMKIRPRTFKPPL